MRNKNRKNNKMNSHSNAVKNFILDFYKILSEFTTEQKPIDQVSLEQRRADTLARLIYGDEICAALCIKETRESINLYIATNHEDESIKARKRVGKILSTLEVLGSIELPKKQCLDSNVMKKISLPFLIGQYEKDVRRKYKKLSEQEINEQIKKMAAIAEKLIDQLIKDYNVYLDHCSKTKEKSSLRFWHKKLIEEGNIINALYSDIDKEDHHLEPQQIKYSTDKIKIFMRDYIKLRNFLETDIDSYTKLKKALGNITSLPNEIESEEIIAASSPLPARKFIEKTINHQGEVISTKEIEVPPEKGIFLKAPKKPIHAEMRLLKYLYPNFINKEDPGFSLYFGISKLCCPQCNLIMKNFFPNIIVTRGHHNIVAKWPLDDSFFLHETAKKNFLTLLFGDELYRRYSHLCVNDQNICIELIQDIGSKEIYEWLKDDLEKLNIKKIPVRTGEANVYTATDDIESPITSPIRNDIIGEASGPSYNTMLANLSPQYDATTYIKESSERVQNPNTYFPSQFNDFFIEDGKAAGKEEEEESFPKKRKREFSHEN